jgi:hypothetical protein
MFACQLPLGETSEDSVLASTYFIAFWTISTSRDRVNHACARSDARIVRTEPPEIDYMYSTATQNPLLKTVFGGTSKQQP